MALDKKRVHWHEVNSETGEVIADKDVDIYTSADAVTCADGETVQEKLDNSLAKKSDIGLLNGLKTTDKTSIVSAINEVKAEITNQSGYVKGTGIELSVVDSILCITYDDGIEEGSEE